MNEQKIKLTDEEIATIYNYRQKQSRWLAWGRFVALLAGILELIFFLVQWGELSDLKIFTLSPQNAQTFNHVCHLAFSGLAMAIMMVLLAIGATIWFWNGNRKINVLIGIIERLTEQEKSDKPV